MKKQTEEKISKYFEKQWKNFNINKKTDLKEAFIIKNPEPEPEEETMYTRMRQRNKNSRLITIQR